MKTHLTRVALAATLMLAFGASAEGQRHPPRGTGKPPAWHGDIHRFHEHDWPIWRGGHWTNGRHDGHLGWWWVVGGAWYFYPSPVYPYPNPYEPPVLAAPPADMPPPTQYWYYCDAAKAYYPYVATCPGGWVQVPATPIPAPPEPQK